MRAYILRRLLFMIPTLLGIMVINFFVIQAAPGGPVEQAISQLQGRGDVTSRFTGGGETAAPAPQAAPLRQARPCRNLLLLALSPSHQLSARFPPARRLKPRLYPK